MSVIDDIYNGDLYPSEQVKPDSIAFKEHSGNAEELSRRLQNALAGDQLGILEAYKSEAAMVTDLYNLEFYRAGVKFGIRLLLEELDARVELPDLHK
jgi:hypothetical protein